MQIVDFKGVISYFNFIYIFLFCRVQFMYGHNSENLAVEIRSDA